MHPAFSVIFFTAVSGAGYGMLFLLAFAIAIDPRAIDPVAALVALGIGAVFATAGLTSSMLHLGKPLRAWRAFSQWRSSWLSREGVAALASFVPLLALGALLWQNIDRLTLHPFKPESLLLLRATAAVLGVVAALTVFCTARIYTSLKAIPAWRDRLVLPGYLAFGLLGGAAWLWVLLAIMHGGRVDDDPPALLVPLLVAMLCAACAMIKREYWQSIDTASPVAMPESATGLGRFGRVQGVEAPHTEQNYLTQEMGFVLARKHSARLRIIAVIAFAVVPVAAVVTALFSASPALRIAAAGIAVLAITAGTFVERWLFFAEAKHVVMLYYGAART